LFFPRNVVIIYGNKFGSESDFNNLKLGSSKGDLKISYWNNEKVIFTVPLDWPAGKLDIWLKRKKSWHGKQIWDRSKKVRLRVGNFKTITTQDSLDYSQALKNSSREVKRLNGDF